MQCILCKSNRYTEIKGFVRTGNEFKVVECLECGHVQCDPMPSTESLQDYFNSNEEVKEIHKDYEKYIEHMIKLHEHETNRTAEFLIKHIDKSNSILEIGAGNGMLVDKMKSFGYIIDGLEISQEQRYLSRKFFGNELLPYNLLSEEVNDEVKHKYHVVCGFHVLHFINNPHLYIKKVIELLKKKGNVIFEIPNYNYFLLDMCKAFNDFFFKNMLCSYFKPNTLRALFAESGFTSIEIIGVQRYSFINAINWLYKGEPQIYQNRPPSYEVKEELSWLEDFYKQKLISELKCDTLIITAEYGE